MEYTLAQMVAEWKMRRGFEPLRIDATYRRQDAFEIDEYARREVDAWYEQLLAGGSVDCLEVDDITAKVNIESFDGHVAEMVLPPDCVRLVEVMMTGWERPAVLVKEDDRRARHQLSPFSRGYHTAPVGVVDVTGLRVRLYAFRNGSAPQPERVMAVMRPPEGMYRFKPVCLNSIKTFRI